MKNIAILLCVLFLSLMGAVITWLVVDKLIWHHITKSTADKKPCQSLAFYSGWTDKFLYILAFLTEQPAFIGIWLAVKTALNWGRESTRNREYYYSFLLGNSLSIILSYLSACIINGDLLFFK